MLTLRYLPNADFGSKLSLRVRQFWCSALDTTHIDQLSSYEGLLIAIAQGTVIVLRKTILPSAFNSLQIAIRVSQSLVPWMINLWFSKSLRVTFHRYETFTDIQPRSLQLPLLTQPSEKCRPRVLWPAIFS